ncbi:O-linked N-acetylglucosamine transferase, SPINDLY family protein [Chitinimonas arctica]|nr:tetratricopeptide repeat protein [Chitinimonas arctica]
MNASLSDTELLDLARQRQAAGDHAAADNFAAMVTEKYPGRAQAWLLRAQLAWQAGRPAQAAEWVTRAQGLAPEDADLQLACGEIWHGLERHPAAHLAYRRAATLRPEWPQAWNQLGMHAHHLGKGEAAAAAYRHALRLDERQPRVHNNYAALLQQNGMVAQAMHHFRRAIELDPQYAIAWKNYAALLQEQSLYAEALTAYERAAMLRPDYAEAISGALLMRLHGLEWDGLERKMAELGTALAAHPAARISPFAMLALDSDPARQLSIARRWARSYRPTPLPARPTAQGERIRLGYLGGDFHTHATAWLSAGLFSGHDRTRFEVFGYDHGENDGSALRARLDAGFDRFVAVRHLDSQALAQRIRSDGIDILVDLKGWTRASRCDVLAWRPAPVQMHYLAYPGTLGADWCDYLIADATVIPPGMEQHYSESIIRLPHSYQINDRARAIAPPSNRQAAGLPEDAFVFCCFNQHYKILPGLFDLWMRLLRDTPGSILWLLDGHPRQRRRLQHEAERRGVPAARLIFAPPLPQAEHLSRLALADLALDTLPCNAHTTASDALWAGLPLLTCTADSFASRVAASCLLAAGLPELVTTTLADYAALARRLARQPDELAALRKRLASQRLDCPLFDTAATIRALEAGYEHAWQRALADQAPAGLDAPA